MTVILKYKIERSEGSCPNEQYLQKGLSAIPILYRNSLNGPLPVIAHITYLEPIWSMSTFSGLQTKLFDLCFIKLSS